MSEQRQDGAAAAFDELLETMRRLRDPDTGCPWDIEQTHASLRDTLLEETYEVLDALTSGERAALVEELGDLLMQVVFHAQIGADDGRFDIREVVTQANEKLVRRHPHVFGDTSARTSQEVKGQWERIKAAERKGRGEEERSMIDGVPRTMPALAYAQAVQDRVGRAGFEWTGQGEVLDKIGEELGELYREESAERREEELGDVLFTVVAAARQMGVDAEAALRGANGRFARRFRHMERTVRQRDTTLAQVPAEEKRDLWRQAKMDG